MTKTKAAKRRARKQKAARNKAALRPARRKTGRRAQLGAQTTLGAVLRGPSRMPKLYRTLQSTTGGGIRLRAMEAIQDLYTSSAPEVQFTTVLNPLTMNLTRLSSLAHGFERFRFRRLRVLYQNACPMTRSGEVMCAIIDDPLAADPLGGVDYANFEVSFVGAVGESLTTALDRNSEKKWWYIHPTADAYPSPSATLVVDPTTRFQGKVVVATGGSVSADTGLKAGYLFLEYDVELDGLRPSFDNCLVLSGPSAFTATDTGAQVHWNESANSVGNWLWEPRGATRPGLGTTNHMDSTWKQVIGDYAVGYLLDWAGATVSIPHSSPRPRVAATCMALVARRDGMRVRGRLPVGCLLETDLVLEDGDVLDDFGTVERESKTDGTTVRWRLTKPLVGKLTQAFWRRTRLAPDAAGDIMVTISGVDASDGTTSNTYYSETHVVGTGAATVSASDWYQVTVPAYARVVVALATGESRVLDTTSANFISTQVTQILDES